jgi:predicted permease
VAGVKLLLVPVIATVITLACYHLLHMPAEVVFGAFLGFGLPTATLGIVFADNYGGDSKNGVIYTLGNTVLSVLTIPLLYWVIVALL